MAKQGKAGVYDAAIKKIAGGGTQKIVKGSDFGARTAWDSAANPSSVKEMVGKSGEFAKYKHDLS